MATATQTTDRIITARAKAFAGHGIGIYRFMVSPDGTVRVYDAVAGHYTRCHSLSSSAIRRIVRLAN